ncbi:hypothetical protein D9M69_516300 [compost metagenome]
MEKNIATMGKSKPLKGFYLPDQQLVTFRVKGASHMHGGSREGNGCGEVELPPGIRRNLRDTLLLLVETLPDRLEGSLHILIQQQPTEMVSVPLDSEKLTWCARLRRRMDMNGITLSIDREGHVQTIRFEGCTDDESRVEEQFARQLEFRQPDGQTIGLEHKASLLGYLGICCQPSC